MDAENTEETWTGSSSRSGRKRRRRSILKAQSPSRQALTDVDGNTQDYTEVTTTTTDVKRERGKRRRSSKRVSFANTHEVKEFMKEKDARELGILESSVDESAMLKKRMLAAQAGISAGPGHCITGLDTLLTAPIVHQTAQDAQSEPGSSVSGRETEKCANKPQEKAKSEVGRETSQNSAEPAEFNFQPQIGRGQPQQSISDFFRTVILGGATDEPDEPHEQATEKTILYRNNAGSDQGNMDMTGSYGHSIHYGIEEPDPAPPADPGTRPPDNPAVTDEVTQQIYCDKLGLLGPTYTCRIPSWDSSDSITLHGSSFHSTSSLSNASLAVGTSSKRGSGELRDVTRVLATEDTTSNMEMTGCIQQRKKPDISSLGQVVSREHTRVFGRDEQTGRMELTTCLRNDSTSHRLVNDDTEGQRETDVPSQDRTMIYGRGDGGMEFTGALHTKDGMRSTERSPNNDIRGKMDDNAELMKSSSVRISDTFAPSEYIEDEDKTVVCRDGHVVGDGDLTECLAVFPDKAETPELLPEVGSKDGEPTRENDLKIQITSTGQEEGTDDPKTSPDFLMSLMDSWKSARAREQESSKAEDDQAGRTRVEMTSNSARKPLNSLVSERLSGVVASDVGDENHEAPADAAHIPDQKIRINHRQFKEGDIEEGESEDPATSPDFLTGLMDSWRAGRSMIQENSRGEENSSRCIGGEDEEAKARMAIISNSAKKQMSDLASHKLPGVGTSGAETEKDKPLVDPTMTLADMSLFVVNQDGPLDSTHIMPSSHMGRRSAFFPSSALKTKPEEVLEPQDAPVGRKSGHTWDSTSKVIEGNKRFVGSAEKTKEALHALKARALDKSQSKTPKAKVGLFQEEAPKAPREKIQIDKVQSAEESKVHSDRREKTHPRVSGYRSSYKSTEELPSNLLDSTPGMKYSSMTLNDELLNSTNGKQSVNIGKRPLETGGTSVASMIGDSQQKKGQYMEKTATYTSQNSKDRKSEASDIRSILSSKVAADISHHQAQIASSQPEKTRQFDSENTAKMELTKCLTSGLQQIMDRENATSGDISGRHLVGSSGVGKEWSLAPDEHTKRFGNEAGAGMEMTTCLTSNLQSRWNKGSAVFRPVQEEHTTRFRDADDARMETTACLRTNDLSEMYRGTVSSGQVPEEHTKRFLKEDNAVMEMTACLTSSLQSRVDKVNKLPQNISDKFTAGNVGPLEAPIRSSGNEDSTGMEMTTCLTSNLQSRIDKENTAPRNVSIKTASGSFVPEEHTRRFGVADAAGLEMTTCVTTSLESNIGKTHSISSKPTASDIGDLTEHTRRFGKEDAAGMEMTTCLTSNLQNVVNKENTAPRNVSIETASGSFVPEEHTRNISDRHAAGKIAAGDFDAPEERTKRFSDAAGMEMTTCLTANLQSGVDKENMVPGSNGLAAEKIAAGDFDAPEEHTRRFGDAAGMEMTTCITSNLHSGVDKENVVPVSYRLAADTTVTGHSNAPEEHTKRFGGAAGMEMTTCLTSNLQSGVDQGNKIPQNVCDKSSVGIVCPLQEHTRIFGNGDAAGMEMTTCVATEHQSRIDKANIASANVSNKATPGNLGIPDEHTRRFGGEDDAGMEMTACVATAHQSSIDKENIASANVSDKATPGSFGIPDEHTRRFGGEDAGGMEMTTCLTSNLQSTVDKENAVPRTVSKKLTAGNVGAPEEYTRRFGNDDAAGMEMTTCMTSNLQSEIAKENSGPSAAVAKSGTSGFCSEYEFSSGHGEHTKRFGNDDFAGMEITSCLTSHLRINKETSSVGDISAVGGSGSDAPEERTRRFGNNDTAGMELTTCSAHKLGSELNDENLLPASTPPEHNARDVSDVVVEHSRTYEDKVDAEIEKKSRHSRNGTLRMNVSSPETAASDPYSEDRKRNFGSGDNGMMELTSKVQVELGDSNKLEARIPESSQGQDKTLQFQEGRIEQMELTGANLMTESSQNEMGGPPPCKKSKPDMETMLPQGSPPETDGMQPGDGTETGALQNVSRPEDYLKVSGRIAGDTHDDVDGISKMEQKTDAHEGTNSVEGDEEEPEMDVTLSRKRQARRETFTLDKSAVLAPRVDGEDADSGNAPGAGDTAEGKEEDEKMVPSESGLLFPGNIWDTSVDGIMEEEFHSPDCTEDLAGVVLGKPAMAENIALNLSQLPTSALETVEEMTATEVTPPEGDVDLIPDDLSLVQFFEMMQTRDGSSDNVNFGRETLLCVDLHKPEELEDFLRLIFVTKPDEEIHDWAITQIQTNLEKFGKCFKPQESLSLREKYPEIFQKLKDQATRQSTYDALVQLHKCYVLSAKNEFHEWNYRMKSSLVDGLKNDIKKMRTKTQTLSEGLAKIEDRIKGLDKGISDIDSALADLKDTSLPTGEEIDEYESNEKQLSDWTKKGQQQQETVQQLEREKFDLKRRGQEQIDLMKTLEAEVSGLDEADPGKSITAREKELEGLRDQLDALQRITEWELKSASTSFAKLQFSFLCDTMDLNVEYEMESGQPAKLKSLSLESHLAEEACTIAKLTHRLVLRSMDVGQLTRDYGTYSALPVMLQLITSKVVRARRLVEGELRQIDWDHPLTIEDCCVQMEFHSVAAHTSFLVTFDLNSFLSGQITATASHDIGTSRLDDVLKILERMKPGQGDLTQTVKELEKLLKVDSDEWLDSPVLGEY